MVHKRKNLGYIVTYEQKRRFVFGDRTFGTKEKATTVKNKLKKKKGFSNIRIEELKV
jgi:hypothetical protein